VTRQKRNATNLSERGIQDLWGGGETLSEVDGWMNRMKDGQKGGTKERQEGSCRTGPGRAR